MNIKITAGILYNFLNADFSYEACEAICDYYDELDEYEAPYLGDISICFCELDSDDVEEDDCVIAELSNRCSLIAR